MDFKIDIEQGTGMGAMTFNKADNIMNNIFLSLSVKKGSFFQNPDFGLDLPSRAKNTAQTAALIEERFRQALRWLLDTGRATKIDVYSERDRLQDLNRLKVLVEATQADGRKVSFETFAEVV
ncbi:MAG: phage protein gp46 [Nitrospirae bacterium]|nr:MAG: phage protein gp46 [Nitrospirota bacterium]